MLTIDSLKSEVRAEDNVQWVYLSGELTAAGGAALDNLCRKLLDCPECPTVKLDLSGLNYVNTAGIALLVAALDSLAPRKTIRTTGLSPHHKRLFRVVGLGRFIETG